MKERPILMSGPMVRAILEGRKTQTRRVVTGKIALEWLEPEMFTPEFVADPGNGLCPYGVPGDRLWVRETWRESYGGGGQIHYAASVSEYERSEKGPWKPSIHMPRAASRLTLEVKAVRVERLQEISEADAIAEGVTWAEGEQAKNLRKWGAEQEARMAYADLWDSINAKRGHGWETNPWVWVVEFERVPQEETKP